MNKVCLTGILSQPVDFKQNGEFGVARTSIALKRDFKDKQTGEYGVDFVNLVAFGNTANFLQKYFDKGSRIGIVGHIQTGTYTDKNGQKRYSFDVVCDNVEFTSSKEDNPTQSAPQQNTQPVADEDGFMNVEDTLEPELPFN